MTVIVSAAFMVDMLVRMVVITRFTVFMLMVMAMIVAAAAVLVIMSVVVITAMGFAASIFSVCCE